MKAAEYDKNKEELKNDFITELVEVHVDGII